MIVRLSVGCLHTVSSPHLIDTQAISNICRSNKMGFVDLYMREREKMISALPLYFVCGKTGISLKRSAAPPSNSSCSV